LTALSGICVSLPPGRLDVLKRLRGAVSTAADLVEVRLDLVQDTDRLESWVAGWNLPVVVACRREEDGGRFHDGEADRLLLLQRAAAAGAALVDLEHHSVSLISQPGWPPRTRFLVSRHDASGQFDRPLAEFYRELAALRPDAVKLVPTARTLQEAFDFLRQLNALSAHIGAGDPPLTAFCMGESGIVTRILALSLGSAMVFAATSRDTAVAPGQVSVDELSEIYRIREIGRETCCTGILGGRVAGSLSPLIHNHLYRMLDLDRCYLPLPARAEELPGLLRRFGAGDLPFLLGGLSITAPFKMMVMPLIDQLAPCAGRAGAVNTIVRRSAGALRGYNTDVHGIHETLRTIVQRSERRRRALIIGAGGAARAAALALTGLGMRLAFVNRTPSRAMTLAREWGGEGGGLDAFCGERFQLVVNATSAIPGQGKDGLPSIQLVDGDTVIFDLNYHPPLTPLLKAGRRLGCRMLDGLTMLACQGERQFRLFTGRRPPPGTMLEVLRAVDGSGGRPAESAGGGNW
jgi:3-dehydroquinate dehydratase/shikimate dehydrogenase